MSTAANNCADILNTEKAKGKKTNKKKRLTKPPSSSETLTT